MARSQRIAAGITPMLATGDPILGVFQAQAGIHPLFWGLCAAPLLVATRAPGSVGLVAVIAGGTGVALAVIVSTLMRHRIVAVTGSAIVVFSCIPLLSSRILRVRAWLPRATPLSVSADGTWRRLSMGPERLWIHHRVAPLVAGLRVPAPDVTRADITPAEPAEPGPVDLVKVSAEG